MLHLFVQVCNTYTCMYGELFVSKSRFIYTNCLRLQISNRYSRIDLIFYQLDCESHRYTHRSIRFFINSIANRIDTHAHVRPLNLKNTKPEKSEVKGKSERGSGG